MQRKRNAFIMNDPGAVTMDFAVVTTGLIGLGLAATASVSQGANWLTFDIHTWMTQPSFLGDRATLDFESSHTGGFSSTNSGPKAEGFDYGAGTWWAPGNALMLPGNGNNDCTETTTSTFNTIEGAETATFEFDVLAMDKLGGGYNNLALYIDGELVGQFSRHWSNNGSLNYTPLPGHDTVNAGISFNRTNSISGGGLTDIHDEAGRVVITIDNPGTTVDIGFGSSAPKDPTTFDSNNNGSGSWAIDNLTWGYD